MKKKKKRKERKKKKKKKEEQEEKRKKKKKKKEVRIKVSLSALDRRSELIQSKCPSISVRALG